MKKLLALVSISAVVLSIGCGASTFTRTRMAWVPGSAEEKKQTKEGITIESQTLYELPADFFQSVQDCNGASLMYTRATKRRGPEPIMATQSILPTNTFVIQVNVTNDTDHVIRMGGTAIALFDPADTQYDALDKDELIRYRMQERPCSSTNNLVMGIQTLKILGANTELLPQRTTKGYLMFVVKKKDLPGAWKSTLYDLPVETDAAGRPTKTVRFEFKSWAKKYIDTYQRENAFATPVKLSTQEVE